MSLIEKVLFGCCAWFIIGHLVLMITPRQSFKGPDIISTYGHIIVLVLLWPLVVLIETINYIRERKGLARV